MESVSAMVSSKPLTKDESKILLSFIESSKIIYNKRTNATNNKLKNEEWKRISDHFNAVVTTSYRTPQQLRLKWENLKKNSRKRNTQIRMNNIKTGGGGPSYIPPDDVLDRVAALLGSTVDGFTVAYGGDAELIPCAGSSNGGGDEHGLEGVIDNVIDNGAEVLECNSGVEVLKECVVEDTGPCSVTPPNPKFLHTPKASGFKRKSKFDEHRASRNQAIANYYNAKSKLLEAKFENIVLENKKLKLEIEKLKNVN
ncbi:uncharacterized protein LOC119628389 [Bombyx mori]|uniref:Regulatory protein zeste n=1 Tax=Bombyx mori TaxID=7091 RepID=A0A8R2M8W0_BOMMO|nr:uncharacterized protein LOC105841800 [Bombyx mori]XP_037875389.1 uncharacterized protein LOC119630355 [Bombyx mori]XP_037875390.1 uncharacterized protein LOC119628389 [Bombyx mori]